MTTRTPPSSPASPLPPQYEPEAWEKRVSSRWMESHAFAVAPRAGQTPYVIMMPLPNVTGALHMGHAIDNVMQDLLTRWHRMRGESALWMPGVDHAGIATQAVMEKRLFELEGKTRHDLGRDGLISRILAWSEQYRKRIIEQQQAMGCSCDWDRHRYTMDDVCRRAVRQAFFNLFRDGLIYRGERMVNWDCQLRTAVSDDEIVRESRTGSFWHLRYPVIDPEPGEPTHVVVATTRPETMLGDTAVACHPDPERALRDRLASLQERLPRTPARDRPPLEEEIREIEARLTGLLHGLTVLAGMARAGRHVRLPLLERPIPLILDAWARPELGSGCVKITPAHDPNDYQVWTRHRDRIGMINILNEDGALNAHAGPYAGLDRFQARARVAADLDARGLVEKVEERTVELALSDRSKTVIEPFVSKQWFVRMADVPGGIVCGRGTGREFRSPGLAQAAMDAASSSWSSPGGRRISFHPDADRYRGTYLTWLEEKRDWCISRQLWWGHRIPVWSGAAQSIPPPALAGLLGALASRPDAAVRAGADDGGGRALAPGDPWPREGEIQISLRDGDEASDLVQHLEAAGFVRDPDVLDTWFSSGLWPHSTLGWPDPATAHLPPGQSPLGSVGGEPDCLSFYYPGSCLVTGRDIITLWVVRMVVLGLYNLGEVPFTDVFVHATILDGKGERMSKSKGNGIDPVDIIERYGADAMRYVLCDMQTGTQDIRLPVQAISPFTGEMIDLAAARHGKSIFSYICPGSGKEFDVLGTMPDLPQAKLVSDRFDAGRNFCNKLWNAARFALMNLEDVAFAPLDRAGLAAEDRWILSRLAGSIAVTGGRLEAYDPSAALGGLRDFFWGDLCDWYLEMLKPRLQDAGRSAAARQVLAAVMDQILRLLHPFVPFVTEVLWEALAEKAPRRGIDAPFAVTPLLIHAAWPVPRPEWEEPAVEARFELVREVVRTLREVRSRHQVPPSRRLQARLGAQGEALGTLRAAEAVLVQLAGLSGVEFGSAPAGEHGSAGATVRGLEVTLLGVVDTAKERERLERDREKAVAELAQSRRKLDNPDFVARAKPEAVDKERARAAEAEALIEALTTRLVKLREA